METTTKQDTTMTLKKTESGPPPPSDLLDFIQAAMFLEDPDLPRNDRAYLKCTVLALALSFYASTIFAIILTACLIAPMLPVVHGIASRMLSAATPADKAFPPAYTAPTAGEQLAGLGTKLAAAVSNETGMDEDASPMPAMLSSLPSRASFVVATALLSHASSSLGGATAAAASSGGGIAM